MANRQHHLLRTDQLLARCHILTLTPVQLWIQQIPRTCRGEWGLDVEVRSDVRACEENREGVGTAGFSLDEGVIDDMSFGAWVED